MNHQAYGHDPLVLLEDKPSHHKPPTFANMDSKNNLFWHQFYFKHQEEHSKKTQKHQELLKVQQENDLLRS